MRKYVLAYLRGWLKPDYPNGFTSKLREQLLLQTLEFELHAEHEKLVLFTLGQFSTLVEDKQKYRKQLLETCDNIRRSLGLNPCQKIAIAQNSSVDSLIKMYKLLEKSGALKKIAELTN